MTAAHPACPICEAGETVPVAGPQTRWRYLRCRGCEHHWLHPAPTQAELTEYYNTAYAVPRAAYLKGVQHEAPIMQRLVATVRPTPGRMLEIGCSYGAMLVAFRDAGWDVAGVELDRRAADYARQTYALRVSTGSLESSTADLRPPYDVITMYHVLEHILDPLAFCVRLRTLTGEGGALVLKTPNNRAVVARLTAGWWQWAADPEHVHLFSPTSLEITLARAGFTVRSQRTRRGDAVPSAFELTRALAKRMLVPGRRHAPDSPTTLPARPFRTQWWYIAGERMLRVVTAPANLLFAGAAKLGMLAEPELLVVAVADRRPPRPAT